MNGRTALVLGAASLGLYMLYRETKLVPSVVSGLGVVTTTPTQASIQAQLIAGAQAAQTIIETVILIPPPPKLIT